MKKISPENPYYLDIISAEYDRTNQRLTWIILLLIALFVGSNLYWILHFLGR